MPPTLEIRIPITPNIRMLTMVRLLVDSLRRNGGSYSGSAITVTMGDDTRDEDIAARMPWLDDAGVEVHWVDQDLFDQHGLFATVADRYLRPSHADVILCADADLVVVGPLDELVDRVHERQTFAGLIAATSPFPNTDRWQELYDHFDLGPVQRDHQLSGWPYYRPRAYRGVQVPDRFRYTPPYFNAGVSIAPTDWWMRAGPRIWDTTLEIGTILDTRFKNQLAIGIALIRYGLPFETLTPRWNFGNSMQLEALHPDELADARIIHILAPHQGVDKSRVFDDLESIEELVARTDLVGANARIRAAVEAVLPDLQSVPTLI